MSDRTTGPDDIRKRVAQGWVGYPTLCIAFAWVGLWALWPELPVVDSARIPRRIGLLVARDGSVSMRDWHKRPDLIALPSPVSFAPLVADADEATGVEYDVEGPSHLLARPDNGESMSPRGNVVALAAEAAREISSARAPSLHGPWRGPTGDPRSSVAVVVSAGLGGVEPQWRKTDEAVLFTMGRAWEVELSLTITDDGRPENVFLEESCGDAAIDRAVIRTLSRPDVWRGAKASGRGTVLVSYSPRAAVGDSDED